MTNKNNKALELNISELFNSGNYIIPIYQRNYAWGNTEITQLIQDIVDYCLKDKNKIYYIGTLIAYERKIAGKTIFETIDGQQRLTTLTILLCLIKNEYVKIWEEDTKNKYFKDKQPDLNLKFDSREKSTTTLQYLFNGESINDKECNIAIQQGYEDAKKALEKILKDFNLSINDFCKYLFEQVVIMRVIVPEDTDLNHYFEIMNTRGEQLEKYEILKAKCLEILDKDDRYAFNLIWEACSNMEKYVQYGFNVDQRNLIFGNDNRGGMKWNTLADKNNVYANLKASNALDSENISISIENLLKPNYSQFTEQVEKETDNPDRFNTIINFPNFLLHILRIQINQSCAITEEKIKDVPLDDKRLIELFSSFLEKKESEADNRKQFIKDFGYNLLRGKFLFDKYIIKREFAKGGDHWSLKSLKWNDNNNNVSYVNSFGEEDSNIGDNRKILMLLSMFHVSNPTLVYKHWLNAALKYVFNNESISSLDYIKYLEELAQAFLFDRFISENPKDYFEIIFTNNGKSNNTQINEEKLNQGTTVENFIFNYLDYLLWKDYQTLEKYYFKEEYENNKETTITDPRIEKFEYTFRSSVEHYYPQHPIEGNPPIEAKWLDDFGNLCLISNSKNSRLSNYMPNAKKDHYKNSPTIDSIKQLIMMEWDEWDTCGKNNKNEIELHGNKMKELLLKRN